MMERSYFHNPTLTYFIFEGRKIPVTISPEDDKRLSISFGFNRSLLEEIKAMDGAKWHGYDKENPRKVWSVSSSSRNLFQIDYLLGKNPYAIYDQPLVDFTPHYKLYPHQYPMVQAILTYHSVILAGEPGTGKTLACIEAITQLGFTGEDIFYVGPKAGVRAVSLEIDKWKCRFYPRMSTYEAFANIMKNWQSGVPAPKFLIFDESQKIKNPVANRSLAAFHCAESLREEYGYDGYVVLLSGTPAPRDPTDWWNQCEIACPGFVREGNIGKFRMRLCLMQRIETLTGSYPKIITWFDDERKCKKCGKYSEQHDPLEEHTFEKSKNEVKYLYERMKGLVHVTLKSQCLGLPDKVYSTIQLQPTIETLRAAKGITVTSTRAITTLMLMRELSDGFRYIEEKCGEQTCTTCHGSGKMYHYESKEDYKEPESKQITCTNCGGGGTIPLYQRSTEYFHTPKEDALIELLEEYEDVGRFIVWSGFQGSLDKIVEICHKYGWATLRVDGRGFVGESSNGEVLDDNDLLRAMDRSHFKYADFLELWPKVCFVGNPKAGGAALTLTASPAALYYSNDFDGQARMQSEDRGHRIGMDMNRGFRIIDLIHLPTDKLVLNNLLQKKELQALSMNDINNAMKEIENV